MSAALLRSQPRVISPNCSDGRISLTINRTSKITFFSTFPPKFRVGAHSNKEDVDIKISVAYISTPPFQIIPRQLPHNDERRTAPLTATSHSAVLLRWSYLLITINPTTKTPVFFEVPPKCTLQHISTEEELCYSRPSSLAGT
jgi:hypothetical protein